MAFQNTAQSVFRGWFALSLALAGLFFARPAHPQGLRGRADESALIAKIAAQDPTAAEQFAEATRALDAQDNVRAQDGFAAVLQRLPQLAVAQRRLAYAKSNLGQRTDAIALARDALKGEDTPESHAGLAVVLLGPGGQGENTMERKEAMWHARQATQARPDDPSFWVVHCQAALSISDTSELGICSKAMLRTAPEEAQSHIFAALHAIVSKQWRDAERAIQRAGELGAPAALTASLRASVNEHQSWFDRYGPVIAYTLAGWIGMIGLLTALGFLLSWLTLRQIAAMAGKQPTEAGSPLRTAYRTVLFVSCVSYYVSLPIVLGLVVLAAVGAVYAFLAIGRIPIKLLLILGLVAIATLWAVLKSILVRPKDLPPGEKLDLDAHPKFRALLEEVAKAVGTRPVDTVYLTPGTDAGVFERGGLGKQLRGATERCLVLGVGLLEGMRADAFRAVLAHEYGHFSSRDTAGGGFALAVRRSLLLTAMGLAEGGAAAWYNPAWLFVRGFYKVFLRISQGASRLQEYIADRVSALVYGPEAFVDGLSHVIKRSIAWDAHVQTSLQEVIGEKRALQNLYTYSPDSPPKTDDLDQAWEEAVTQAPSAYDSHPCPQERFVWVRSFAHLAAPREPSDELAWDLMGDRTALERLMTDRIRNAVAENHGIEIRLS